MDIVNGDTYAMVDLKKNNLDPNLDPGNKPIHFTSELRKLRKLRGMVLSSMDNFVVPNVYHTFQIDTATRVKKHTLKKLLNM
jgi:hypothetical protein